MCHSKVIQKIARENRIYDWHFHSMIAWWGAQQKQRKKKRQSGQGIHTASFTFFLLLSQIIFEPHWENVYVRGRKVFAPRTVGGGTTGTRWWWLWFFFCVSQSAPAGLAIDKRGGMKRTTIVRIYLLYTYAVISFNWCHGEERTRSLLLLFCRHQFLSHFSFSFHNHFNVWRENGWKKEK